MINIINLKTRIIIFFHFIPLEIIIFLIEQLLNFILFKLISMIMLQNLFLNLIIDLIIIQLSYQINKYHS
jgi:hypothetical protein